MIHLAASSHWRPSRVESRSGRVKGEEIRITLERKKSEKTGCGGYENRSILKELCHKEMMSNGRRSWSEM